MEKHLTEVWSTAVWEAGFEYGEIEPPGQRVRFELNLKGAEGKKEFAVCTFNFGSIMRNLDWETLKSLTGPAHEQMRIRMKPTPKTLKKTKEEFEHLLRLAQRFPFNEPRRRWIWVYV